MWFWRSETYRLKIKGPSIDPCGTPNSTVLIDEVLSSIWAKNLKRASCLVLSQNSVKGLRIVCENHQPDFIPLHCLGADVSHFLCCTRPTKEIGDVCTQATLFVARRRSSRIPSSAVTIEWPYGNQIYLVPIKKAHRYRKLIVSAQTAQTLLKEPAE